MQTRSRLRITVFLAALGIISAFGIVFSQKREVWAVMSAAMMICGGAFTAFESKKTSSGEIASAAVMTALSVAGRIAFAAVPAFKPCSAIIILSGMYLGAGQGFMVGALTALVSNFYFSQGIWTPFQMLAWGLTGLAAGLLGKALRKSLGALMIFAALAGAAFSVAMDIFSCLWTDGTITIERFLALSATSLWFTAAYAASNAVFLFMFRGTAKRIFSRLYNKYAIGIQQEE